MSSSVLKQTSGEAEAHIKSAHQILKALQEEIGEHPEIGANDYEARDGTERSSGSDGPECCSGRVIESLIKGTSFNADWSHANA